jgi:murein DD-endopeptidase MepM/ murein hydrolase activator NlpD
MTSFSLRLVSGLLMLALIAGCTTTPSQQVKGRAINPAPAAIKITQAKPKETVYFVRAGDTLSAIGRRFGITSRQLQYHNDIADPHRLKIGARLVIPGSKQQVPASFAGRPPFIWPLKKLDVSSEFGSRNNRHKGIDLRAPQGTAIFASADGEVLFAGRKSGYGKVIILKHADNIQTFYAHNEKNLVSKGQRIRQGEKIATVGQTGNATGNHVHFEFIRGRQPLSPRHYVSG